MYALKLITILAVMFGYWLWLHLWKRVINEWLDVRAPKWVTTCEFCRGFWFGVPFGLLLAILLVLTWKGEIII